MSGYDVFAWVVPAIYTEHLKPTHVVRRVILCQIAILNYVNPF
jgi:hypothetical protein